MDLNYSNEQQMLADSLRRFLDTEYSFEKRRTRINSQASFDPDAFSALADLGVLGLGIAPQYGGFGEDASTQMLVQMELGRALVLEPVIASSVISGAILEKFGSDVQKELWLTAMVQGKAVVSPAYLESNSRESMTATGTRYRRHGDHYVLSGHKCLIWHGGVADAFLVSAYDDEQDAHSVFLIPSDTPGVSRESHPTFDGLSTTEITLSNVSANMHALVGEEGRSASILEFGMNWGVAALCAEAAGASARLTEITVDYLKTREQFGKPLATFQSLQHAIADMAVKKELAISMAYVAAQALSEPDALSRKRMLSAAKVTIGRAGRFIGQRAVQLHGGMGMTHELAVGDYFKRLTAIDQLLGSNDYHLQRFSDAMQD